MDFDDAKENIQPLSTGRNPSILHASITHTTHELIEQRREMEALIQNYNGSDPLEPWYNYISWIEQSFPSAGKESGLMQVLSKCLRRFESEERYYQDRRMIKLFIKFLDSCKSSTESYQQLYNAGVGTMVADFYIAWAYCYDSVGNMRMADEVFRRGLACRAEPLEELKEAHQHFALSVAQRTLYKDDDDALQTTNRQIEERRSVLSSLRGYRTRGNKNEIGSIRTGVAVKSSKPGTIEDNSVRGASSKNSHNSRVSVLSDENVNPNQAIDINDTDEEEKEQSDEAQSANVVRSIVDKAREQENDREPGPWNKVHDKGNTKMLKRQKKITHELGFNIHEDNGDEDNLSKIVIPDSELNYLKPFKYPNTFISKNRQQPEWIVPVTTECQPHPNSLPHYNKSMIYPRPNREFQTEELLGYLYFKKRGIENAFTQRYSMVWGNDISVPLRLYPNFARNSIPQTLDESDAFFALPAENGMKALVSKIYDMEKQEEFQNEELMARIFQNNMTVMEVADMDETMCTSSNNEQVQRRRSFFPSRRSLAIRSIIRRKDEDDIHETTAQSAIENNIEPNSKPSSESKKTNPLLKTILQEDHASTSSFLLKSMENTTLCTREKELLPLDTDKKLKSFNENSVSKIAQNSLKDNFEQISRLQKNSKPADAEFYFKTPALPEKVVYDGLKQASPLLQDQPSTSKKPEFEIYKEDDIQSKKSGIFDPDESCSTQVFNNFITAQPASTPKALHKEQKRQFGVLLTAPMMTSVGITTSAPSSSLAIENIGATHASDDPSPNSQFSTDIQIEVPRPSIYTPQLSIILETSEHATTQGTHSTGTSSGTTTTKSSNGSHESDLVDTAINTNALHKTHPHSSVKEHTYKQTKDFFQSLGATNLSPKPSMSAYHIEKPNDEPVVYINSNKFCIYEDEEESVHQLSKSKLGEDLTIESNQRSPVKDTSCQQTRDAFELLKAPSFLPQPSKPAYPFQKDKDKEIDIASNQFSIYEDDKEMLPQISAPKTTLDEGVLLTDQQTSIKELTFNQKKMMVPESMRDTNLSTKVSMFERPHTQEQNNVAVSVPSNKFSIYEDEEESFPHVPKARLEEPLPPDFEHMIQREDTISKCLIVCPSSCFREEKTETMSKIVIPRNTHFPIEEIDTIPTIHDSMFSYDVPKIPKTPFLDAQVPMVETFQQNTTKSTSEKDLVVDKSSAVMSTFECLNLDDSKDPFEIFRMSPPKGSNYGSTLSHNTSKTERVSAKLASSKPNSMRNNSQIDFQKYFENEMMNVDNADGNDNKVEYANFFQKPMTAQNQTRKNDEGSFGNSFQLELSLTEKTISKDRKDEVEAINIFENKSHFPESHVISQSNRQEKSISTYDMLKTHSFLPESSFIPETQSQTLHAADDILQQSSGQKNKSNFSFLKEASFMPHDSSTKDIYANNPKNEISGNAKKSMMQPQQFHNFPPNSLQLQESTLKVQNGQLEKSLTAETSTKNPVSQPHRTHPRSSFIPKRVVSKQSFTEIAPTRQISSSNQQDSMINNISFDTSLIPETQEQPRRNISKFDNLPNTKNDCNKNENDLKETFQVPAAITKSHLKQHCLSNSERCSNSILKSPQHQNYQIFELNAETETFSTGLNMIKNSTMLSNSPPRGSQEYAQIAATEKKIPQQSMSKTYQQDSSIQSNFATKQDMSIYYKHTPHTPRLEIHDKSWSDTEENSSQKGFIHHEVDLNETAQRIRSMCENQQINPFNTDLQTALLDNIDFVKYLSELKNTMVVGRVPRLSANSVIELNDVEFKVMKLVGEGAYGTIYRGVEKKSGKQYAFKQERPPNYWEYYICLEVQSRIPNEEILSAYMNIDYALIGNNASILISSFSPYGSIISVCNQIKKRTMKNIDENVCMLLTCELFEIIDHLHAINIIHADIKADNFILMKKLTYDGKGLSLQLIDFGVSIDMKQFKKTQTFTYIHNEDAFKCVEMRENRPWTYQLDLYGLAGIIHVMLFGKYMEIEKRADKGIWMPKTPIPRYINKLLWEPIFRNLLNIRDCKSMPNLQEMRARIKEEMAAKESYVISKIVEFNKSLD